MFTYQSFVQSNKADEVTGMKPPVNWWLSKYFQFLSIPIAFCIKYSRKFYWSQVILKLAFSCQSMKGRNFNYIPISGKKVSM